MYLGIDIGTSSVKSVLIDHKQRIVGSASETLTVSRPQPTWSEQDPEDWCRAAAKTLDELRANKSLHMARVASIGLSGQMHGATLLDKKDQPIRPAILWNDGRADLECEQLESICTRSREISGNIAMPGFTAPKLLWVKNNEARKFAAVRKVLLPKDYVRWWLSGDYISDMSDAAGTLWLDVAARAWSEEMLAATGLGVEHMPRLVEGTEPAGELRADLARRWGMKTPPRIAGGASDNAASACGIGAVNPGCAFLSLGTSGVVFVTNDGFSPNTDGAVHAFCHALPDTWHQMGVVLSAAVCFDWLAAIIGCPVSDLYADLEQGGGSGDVLFLPYLSGERTPHNDAGARGAFVNLVQGTGRSDLSRALAEGVAFACRDCVKSLSDAGTEFNSLVAVGGGARSKPWLQILADILDKRIEIPAQGETGAAFGAARLAMIADSGDEPGSICRPPPIIDVFEPEPATVHSHQQNWARYRALYPALKEALLK
jgi:xylulokinase